jgi:hypothetical protein
MVISPVDTIDLIPNPTVVSPEDPIPNSKPKMQSPLIIKNLSYHGKEIKWDKTTKQWTVYYNCSHVLVGMTAELNCHETSYTKLHNIGTLPC